MVLRHKTAVFVLLQMLEFDVLIRRGQKVDSVVVRSSEGRTTRGVRGVGSVIDLVSKLLDIENNQI